MITVKDVEYNGFRADVNVDESVYRKIQDDTIAELRKFMVRRADPRGLMDFDNAIKYIKE